MLAKRSLPHSPFDGDGFSSCSRTCRVADEYCPEEHLCSLSRCYSDGECRTRPNARHCRRSSRNRRRPSDEGVGCTRDISDQLLHCMNMVYGGEANPKADLFGSMAFIKLTVDAICHYIGTYLTVIKYIMSTWIWRVPTDHLL